MQTEGQWTLVRRGLVQVFGTQGTCRIQVYRAYFPDAVLASSVTASPLDPDVQAAYGLILQADCFYWYN